MVVTLIIHDDALSGLKIMRLTRASSIGSHGIACCSNKPKALV